MGLGDIAVLNGTKHEGRMKDDMAAPLAVDEFIKTHPGQWQQLLKGFQAMVGDPH
jgi:hypothetical protein